MKRHIRLALLLTLLIIFPAIDAQGQWTAKLDKTVTFYQTTELGVVLVGTEKSLYAIDGATGETLWRRKDASLDETDVAPVPGTDLLLLSFEKGSRTRVEAVDVLTGDTIWKGDKIRGAVMQLAMDSSANLLAVVFAKDAKGHAGDSLKRRPLLYVFDLASGDELWKQEISEVEMMPARWADGDVDFPLDTCHAPAFVDGLLYVFYEGLTSFDARTGKSRLRERYRVNRSQS